MQPLAELPQEIYDAFLRKINDVVFSSREIEVIAGILLERPTQQIPDMLPIIDRTDQNSILFGGRLSENTVSSHIDKIYEKLSSLLEKHKEEVRSKTTKRDKIKYVIEKSREHKFFGKYCVSLQIENAFLMQLEAIFRKQLHHIQLSSIGHCQIRYWEANSTFINPFYIHLARHLNDRKDKDDQKIITTIFKKTKTEEEKIKVNYMLYVVPNELRTRFDSKEDPIYGPLSENSRKVLFLLDHWKNKKQIPEFIKNTGYVHIGKREHYYESVFKILKKMFPDISIDEEIKTFQDYCTAFNPKDPSSLKRKILVGLAAVLVVSCFGLLMHANHDHIQENSIRSDLAIPVKSSFLERPELIKQVGRKLEGNDSIKTVAIVGMGGVGKTTLARQFCRSYKTPVVWEINAETHEQLIRSFKDLAYAFTKTQTQKDELDFIQAIQNQDEKEKQLLSFVKNNLRNQKQWLLVYDNVIAFSEIKDYFPQDENVWGVGKVIITTRDATFQNSAFINPENVIHLEALTKGEDLVLFTRILFGYDPNHLKQDQLIEAARFLEHIPPFPLDISTAAYYIKNVHIPYDQYLKQIYQNSQEFEKTHESLAKQTSHYTKTRYGIISLSIQKLIEQDPRFKELLLFVSLIDSQNIPKKLLTLYSDETTINAFLSQLKKQSLIVDLDSQDQTEPRISLHRSTQALCLSYLKTILNSAELNTALSQMSAAMKSLYQFSIIENIKLGELLLPHLDMFLKNIDALSLGKKEKGKYTAYTNVLMGYVYNRCMKNRILSRESFLRGLAIHKNCPCMTNVELAHVLSNLGYIYEKMHSMEESTSYCQESLNILKTIPHSEISIANNLSTIGFNYAHQNNFEAAKHYFEAALDTIKNIDSEKKKTTEANIYKSLALLYGLFYLNKDTDCIAEHYAKKALALVKGSHCFVQKTTAHPKLPDCTVVRHKMFLGEVYNLLGRYSDAITQGFEEAAYIVENKIDNCNHSIINSMLFFGFGVVLLRKGQLDEAERNFNESIQISQQLVGELSTSEMKVFRAEARVRLGKLDEAYEDCASVFTMGHVLRNPYYDLLFSTCYYHAAVIKYRQGDLKKSIEHFSDFFRHIQTFCQSFLDKTAYFDLETRGAFKVSTSDLCPLTIQDYMNRSIKIFSAIHGNTHSFVTDYVTKNCRIE